MRILITTATDEELAGIQKIQSGKHMIVLAVTGVGMVATTYNLTKILARTKFDLAINAGIAGSFDRTISIGEVVAVIEDVFSEQGAEDDQDFLSLSDLGLPGQQSSISNTLENYPSLSKFRRVKGITVNTVHGNEVNIAKVVERLQPQIETMEGAAFYHVCEMENIPAIQLRAISNYIEKRNKENWNIPLAIRNVNDAIQQLIKEI